MAAGDGVRTRSVRVLATALIVALCAFMLISIVVTFVARLELTDAVTTLRRSVFPAVTKATALESAYVEGQSRLRGFLLTGDRAFLDSFRADTASARTLETELRRLVANDAPALADLRSVGAAYAAWKTGSAEPEIAARRAGPVSQVALSAMVSAEHLAFSRLRLELGRLTSRTDRLSAIQVDRISATRKVADVVTVVALVLAAIVALLAVPVLRRVLTGPLDRLVRQVQRVAGGDYERAIVPEGAAELVTLAGATERMRRSLVERSEALVEAQGGLTLRAERDRLAADLHDLSIQRMYALGLSLASLSKRHPGVAPAVERLIAETDDVIRELRAIIFNLDLRGKEGLRRGVDQLVHEAAQSLGFPPVLELRGDVDAAVGDVLLPELLAVLREALSNAARHARASSVEVVVSAQDHRLEVLVLDNGVGPGAPRAGGRGLGNMHSRAVRLGGSAVLTARADGGSVLTWTVPIGTGDADAVPPGASSRARGLGNGVDTALPASP